MAETGGDVGRAVTAVRRNKGAVAVSVIVMIIVFGWLIIVWFNIGAAPVMGSDGKTVIYDPFLRSKDVFALILPLLTTAVGFWLGSQGTVEAQRQAKTAHNETVAAKDQTAQTNAQKAAIVAVAAAKLPVGDDLMAEARHQHPEAFSDWGK
jgi:hypothetical protein